MSQQGRLEDAPSDLETLTGDSGGAVPADGAGNINIVGGGTTTVTGNPGTNTLTVDVSSAGYPITPYVVGPSGQAGYTTIQAGLDAANAAGGGIVFVQPGTYTENLTLYDDTQIVGAVGLGDLGALVIDGIHTPPTSGAFVLRNCKLQSATHIFNSAAAGTSSIFIIDVAVDVTNGYVFNLPNWTSAGGFGAFDIGEIGSTNDGWVNNTGGATVFMTNITMGAGSGNSMITSGFVELYNCVVQCPVDFQTGTNGIVAGGSIFQNTVTFSNNSTLEIYNSVFDTGANQALIYNSSANSSLSTVSINSSNNPSIGGTGVGTLQLTGISFLNDSNLAGTLTLSGGRSRSGSLLLSDSTEHAVPLFGTDGLVSEIGPLTNGQLIIGSTGVAPAAATLASADASIAITNGAGTIDLALNSDIEAINHGWNGSILETAAVTVTSDGATVTLSVEQNGGGDLTVVFSDGFFDWDTTPPDTITLTAGSDTSPTENYVYFLQSTKALTVSTSAFPSAEHAPLATVVCQSAASLQTDGAYKVHAWTDHVTASTDQGHIADINSWIRNQNATWLTGVVQTYTITTNGGSADNVILTTASGTVLQLHSHAFPAFSGTPDVYVVNDSVTPYNKVTDLNALLTDSTGASMSGRYFSLVIWGVVSESAADCKLYCNLPGGSYNNAAGVEEDLDGFSNFTIPPEFKGTGFLISEWKLRHQAASGGTWTSISELDLRGLLPAVTAGGGGGATGSEFIDNAFRILDDGDNTKEIAFQADQITTATTRTITMVDADLDLATVSASFPTDSGTATPATNVLTIAGGGSISTSAAGSTVTITDSGAQFKSITSLDNTDSPYTVLSTDYYLSCDVSGGVLTIQLPDAPTTGRSFVVKDLTGDSETNNISVTTVSGVVTIDGQTTFPIDTDFESADIIFNGTSYEIF